MINNDKLKEDFTAYNVQKLENIPQWIQVVDFEENNNPPINAEGGIRYLLVDEQYYVETNKITKYGRSIRQPITMEGVEESSKFLVEFNPKCNELQINKILVTRDGLKIDKLPTADMQILKREYQAESNIFSGEMTLSIILDNIKINDKIEFIFTIINHDEFDTKFFNKILQLEYGVLVQALYLTIIFDQNVNVHYKFLSEIYELQRVSQENKIVYLFCRKNIPAKALKKYLPYWYRQIAFLQIAKKVSWSDIAKFLSDLYPPTKIDPKLLISVVGDLNNLPLSSEEIILRILSFIKKNIRYLSNFKGINSIKPTDPNITLERSYGDCKDLTYLYVSILQACRIQSYPVVVNTQFGRCLNEYLPSIGVFNHAIVVIILNNEKYFIDPTIRQDVNLLEHLYLPNYGYGLICNKEIQDLTYIKNTKSRSSFISVSDEYRIESWQNNSFIFNSKIILRGWHALKLMQYIDNQSEEKFIDSVKEFYNRFMTINEIIESKIDTSRMNLNEISYFFSSHAVTNTGQDEINAGSLQILPMDILENLYYPLPSNLDYDFYYGPPIKIDYNIRIFAYRMKYAESNREVIAENLFKLSKKIEKTKTDLLIKYQFDKYGEVVVRDQYSKFLSAHQKAIEILPIQVSKNEENKSSKFSFGFIFYLIILFMIIVGCLWERT